LNDETHPVRPAPPAGAPAGPPRPAGSLWRHVALIRHWATFIGILGVLVAISQWKAEWVNTNMSEATAQGMAWIMTLLGEQGTAKGVRVGSNVCRFTIIGECTAYYPLAIYVAAILAFPSPWLRRILGIVAGVPLLLLINQVRLVSLCYIHRSFPEHFEVIHIVVWQSLIIFFTVLVWILWVLTIARRP